MSDSKKIQEQALEATVYLPVGFVLAARDEIPKLTAKGKAYVTNQLTMARAVGTMVVSFGSKEAEKRLHGAVKRLGTLWGEKPVGGPSSPVEAEPAPVGGSMTASSNGAQDVRANGSAPAAPPGTPRRSGVDLAIPGYDALSASQVVQRLAGLSAVELEAVEEYENATRGRKTIVNRARQLLSPTAGDS